MKQLEITINNETGLHARPAKTLVNLVKQFKSEIVIRHGEKKANAKSLISVLTLRASKGSQLKIEVNGEDEETALAQIEAAILSGLGFLKEGGLFTDDVIDAYIGLKMQEVTRLRMSTHPVELELYYSV